jgi:N4-gp56 family major capsid protein
MDMLKKFFAVFMADTPLNVHTTSDLDNFIPEHWDTKVRRDSERKSFWDKFEGSEGSNSAIIRRDDFTAKAGDVVHVNVHANLDGAGVSGETELKGKEEKLSFSQFDLKVEWIRHAVGFNKRGTKQALLNAMSVANSTLSTWLARRKDDDLTAQLLDLGAQRFQAAADTASVTTLYPNAVVSQATLTNADTFGTAEINKIKTALNRKLALPIETVMDGKQLVSYYGIVLDDIAAEYYLKSDPVWQQAQREAGLRSDANRLFNGAFGSWNSCVIYSIQGKAGQGSFLRPEVQLSATSLANAAVVFGSAALRRPFIQYFKDGDVKYMAVKTDGTEIAVTMDAGDFSTKMDETDVPAQYQLGAHTHAELDAGTLITPENHMASAIGFGSEIAARVWGMQPKPITDVRDYGFQYGVGVEAVYGCKMIEDSAKKAPNHVILRHYCKNPYLGI